MSDPQKNGATTTIGPTIIIRGKLKSDEDLVVRGRIDAEITSTKALHVENSGVVKANVQVDSVRISGALAGNIQATQRVEIASDGRVVGDIIAPRIVISDGAAFKGRIDMQFEAGAARTEAAAPPAHDYGVPEPLAAAAMGGGESTEPHHADGGERRRRRF